MLKANLYVFNVGKVDGLEEICFLTVVKIAQNVSFELKVKMGHLNKLLLKLFSVHDDIKNFLVGLLI